MFRDEGDASWVNSQHWENALIQFDMCGEVGFACLHVCRCITGFFLTQHHPQSCSLLNDVRTQLEDDILLRSANTGHYCSVLPAPPCRNPVSVCMCAADHMNSLKPHPSWQYGPTIATARRCQTIFWSSNCPLFVWEHLPLASTLLHFHPSSHEYGCCVLILIFVSTHRPYPVTPDCSAALTSVRNTSWHQTAAQTWKKK